MKIKTLLVDDSIPFLTVARRYLSTQPVEVVGEAQSGSAALQIANEYKPDLTLLDLELGDVDGLAVLRKLKLCSSPMRVVVVTLYDQDEYREAALQAGADGFIAKQEFVRAFPPVLHRLFEDTGVIKTSQT